MRRRQRPTPTEPEDLEAVVYRAQTTIPGTSIEEGDDVVFNPKAPRLFTLCKRPEPAAVLAAISEGTLVAFGPGIPLERLAAIAGVPLPGPMGRPTRVGYLTVVDGGRL